MYNSQEYELSHEKLFGVLNVKSISCSPVTILQQFAASANVCNLNWKQVAEVLGDVEFSKTPSLLSYRSRLHRYLIISIGLIFVLCDVFSQDVNKKCT